MIKEVMVFWLLSWRGWGMKPSKLRYNALNMLTSKGYMTQK